MFYSYLLPYITSLSTHTVLKKGNYPSKGYSQKYQIQLSFPQTML